MNTAQGVVDKIIKKKAYSVLVNEVWYGCGFAEPKFKEGTTIKFAYEDAGRWKNMDMDSVEILPDAPKAEGAPASAPTGGVRSNWPTADERANTQKEIRYQASRNAAIAMVDIIVNAQALPVPATAKPAQRLEAIVELVRMYTDEFNSDTVAINSTAASAEEAETSGYE